MNAGLMEKIKRLKQRFLTEGFEIVGVFGSFARNEESPESDIDLLYRTTDKFVEKYMGFFALDRLVAIREELKKELNLTENLEIVSVIALGKPVEEVIVEELTDSVKYWRDEKNVHHVPKRKLTDLIIE